MVRHRTAPLSLLKKPRQAISLFYCLRRLDLNQHFLPYEAITLFGTTPILPQSGLMASALLTPLYRKRFHFLTFHVAFWIPTAYNYFIFKGGDAHRDSDNGSLIINDRGQSGYIHR